MERNQGTISFLWQKRYSLTFFATLISCVSIFVLYGFNMLPTGLATLPHPLAQQNPAVTATTTKPAAVEHPIIPSELQEKPVRVHAENVGLDVAVNNPISTEVAVLDDYLTRGAVRYPGSGTLGNGNLFIFGHSTSFKVVHNPAYQAFNGLKYLQPGDFVYVDSFDNTYTYVVSSVHLVDSREAFVDFSANKNELTLSTCNTFGKKEERYVVKAQYVSVSRKQKDLSTAR